MNKKETADRDFDASRCSSASSLDSRMETGGWVKIAPGMYKPGPELSARMRRVVSDEEIKAFIRKYASSESEAEDLIKDIYGRR